MVVRPRLVEEGAPIYGPGSDAPSRHIPSNDDLDMIDGDHHKFLPPTSTNSTAAPRCISSLQLAAKASGAMLPPKRRSKTLSSSHEIGTRPSHTAAANNHCSADNQLSSWNFEVQSQVHSTAGPYQQGHYHSQQPITHQHHVIAGDLYKSTNVDCKMDMDEEHQHRHAQHHHHHDQRHHDKHSQQEYYQGNLYQQSYEIPGVQYESSMHQQDQYSNFPSVHRPSALSSPPAPPSTSHTTASYTIGGNNTSAARNSGPIEKMVGVEDHGKKAPLLVLDGANVAHAYAKAFAGLHDKGRGACEPDATGIQVATDYLQIAGVRVLVVLPQYWFSKKPQPGYKWNDRMNTPQLEVLNRLQAKGLIVASPPADDDDAYALTIARREESRSLRRNGEGPGFVLSNDMFRDAQERDTTERLKLWLNNGRHESVGPGRISYSFADMGTMNDHGERILDFVPNPRHPLIIWLEGVQLSGTVLS